MAVLSVSSLSFENQAEKKGKKNDQRNTGVGDFGMYRKSSVIYTARKEMEPTLGFLVMKSLLFLYCPCLFIKMINWKMKVRSLFFYGP